MVVVHRIVAVVLASAALGVAAGVVALGGGGGPAPPTYVVLETDGPLRPVVTTVAPDAAQGVAHAAGAPDPSNAPLKLTGEVYEFVDPNGGQWRVVEYTYAGWTYWAVDPGEVFHDPTLDVDYNAAFIVDGAKLPPGATLAFTSLALPLPSVA